MNTNKKCPHCQKEVDIKATKCPYCQSAISTWTSGKKLLLVLLIPVFVGMVMSFTDDSTTNTPAQMTAEDIAYQKKHDFPKLAKMEVEAMLKAPATAKFNTSPTVTLEDGVYSVDSWVDSENSYGANIRSYWSAKPHYIGGDTQDEIGNGANWIIDEFIFDGKKIK